MAQIKITITIEATLVRDAHEALDAMDALLLARGGRVVSAKLVPVGEQRDADGNKLFSLAKYAYTAPSGDAHLFAEREAFVAEQDEEVEPLSGREIVAALAALPAYNGWTAAWEYPGYLAFHRSGSPSVFATPDHNDDGQIAIDVHRPDGRTTGRPSIAWPLKGRTPESYMAIMRPVLDDIASPLVESDEIFENVMSAMQNAEEMGGPEGAQYVALMERIAHEAQRRADRMREKLALRCAACNGTGLAAGAYCDDCDATGTVQS